MNVADLMTRQVVAIDPETPLAQAIGLMTRVQGQRVAGGGAQ